MFGIDDAIVGSVGGALVTGLLNNDGAEDRMNAANAFSAQQYATRYQTTMKDMAAAGLNPMLAYSGISGTPPTGAMANPGGYPDLGQAFVNSAQKANTEADTALKTSNLELIDATVEKTKQETKNLSSMEDQIKATVDNLRVQRENMIKEGYNLTEQGNVLRKTVEKMGSEIFNLTSSTQRNYALEALNKVQAELTGYDVKAAKDLGNLGREAGQLKPIFDILRVLFRK